MKRNDFDEILLAIAFGIFALVVMVVIVGIAPKKVEGASTVKEVSFAECKGNLHSYIYRNGILMKEWEEVYEQQRADWEARHESEVDEVIEETSSDNWRSTFGYVPNAGEIALLKRAVTAECGYCEPDAGIEAVICVIANRCRGRGQTITEVLSAPGQFETWRNGKIQSSSPSRQVERVVERTCSSGKLSDRSVLYFTAGRYNKYCEPAYIIGNHYFGYERKDNSK